MHTRIRTIFLTLLTAAAFHPLAAQQVMPLYPGGIPNSRDVPNEEYTNKDSTVIFKVSRPTLTLFTPEHPNGTAIVVCPGGGYHDLVIGWEGYQVARILNARGITAVVLKYRLPSDVTMKDKSIGPLQDAQQAVLEVRRHAAAWGIDTSRVGIMGFSAGGHLASTEGTHFSKPLVPDPEGISVRPDFMILVYPVISMELGVTHMGSRVNLLGKNPTPAQVKRFSNDEQVTPRTPPAFIIQAEDDSTVSVENSLRFFSAMLHNRVPASLHIYPRGGHGFGKYPPRDHWMNDLFFWMSSAHFLGE
jgi:acetyl esterase/lipase